MPPAIAWVACSDLREFSNCFLEGDAVLDEEESIRFVTVSAGKAIVAEAVADIQTAVILKCELDAGREIAEAVLATHPVGHEPGS
jgi:hypothetical protein